MVREEDAMTAQFLGGCACGAIRYACDVAPAAVFHCHCRDCQRSSGAPMATVAIVPRMGFSLLSGRPRSYAVTTNSGNTMRREFCGDCGSPLFLDLAARPDIWIIRATSFDDPGAFKPSMHVWTGSAQPWDRVNDGLACYPGNPPG
jgi:hypothetical protein